MYSVLSQALSRRAKLPHHIIPLGPAILRAAAFAGFSQTQDVEAVGCELLLGGTGIGIWSLEQGTYDVEEVAIGPIVSFDQGPEADHESVDVGIEPGTVGTVGHGFAEGSP